MSGRHFVSGSPPAPVLSGLTAKRRFTVASLGLGLALALAACDASDGGEATGSRYEDRLVLEGPVPVVSFDGRSEPFILRDGLVLPPRKAGVWNGETYTLRMIEQGGELPYSPPPPMPDEMDMLPFEAVYPNIAMVGGIDDPASALLIHLSRCYGGYDPETDIWASMPQRFAPTGEWVFDIGGSTCTE